MPYCSSCGARIDIRDSFCSNCGIQIRATQQSNLNPPGRTIVGSIRCPKCKGTGEVETWFTLLTKCRIRTKVITLKNVLTHLAEVDNHKGLE
jgi:hypothetical protein